MDFKFISHLLQMNLGRGFYSYEHFERAPEIRTDASKGRDYCGGGYVSACGRYSFWRYGSRAARNPIDYLEGDTVVAAATEMGETSDWKNKVVPFGVDNMAFQKSAAKGRSKAHRLNILVRELFALQLRFQCIFEFFWLSSKDNLLADDLSRDREGDFLEACS